jgi:hypothetical protein
VQLSVDIWVQLSRHTHNRVYEWTWACLPPTLQATATTLATRKVGSNSGHETNKFNHIHVVKKIVCLPFGGK